MPRYAFIACSKTKKSVPCKAREVYQGTLFKKSLQFVLSQSYTDVFILSAKYGLLELDQVIDPYELTLKTFSKSERREWASKVQNQISEKQISGEFWFFTGALYHEFFDGVFPLAGLALGRQLQWFDNRLQKNGFDL